MIHYHHSDGGMKRQVKARFLQGRHGLVSFAYQSEIGVVADVCQSFVLDNGAYTIWKKGEGRIDYEGYVSWVRKWHKHPGFDWALIPDVIDGDEPENDQWVDRWPDDLRGVPVWHVDESIGRLQRLCRTYHTVALGSSGEWSSPGSKSWWTRMKLVMDKLCDSEGRPPAKLHGLRMLNPDVFTKLPLASADSMNAVRRSNDVQRFGTYTPPTANQRAEIVAERIESQNSAAVWERVDQKTLFTNGTG